MKKLFLVLYAITTIIFLIVFYLMVTGRLDKVLDFSLVDSQLTTTVDGLIESSDTFTSFTISDNSGGEKNLDQAIVAFVSSDYTTANNALDRLVAKDDIEANQFYSGDIVDLFLPECACKNGIEEKLQKWSQKFPTSPYPYIIKSAYYDDKANEARGTSWIRDVTEENLNIFRYNLIKSHDALDKAIELNGNLPSLYSAKIQLFRHGNITEKGPSVEEFFDKAVKKFPLYEPLYRNRMTHLEPKWGGSVQEMSAFVQKYGQNFPLGERLNLMAVKLHFTLNDEGNCEDYKSTQCDQQLAQYFQFAPVKTDIITALHKIKSDNLVTYNSFVKDVAYHYSRHPQAARLLHSYLEEVISKDNYIMKKAHGNDLRFSGDYKGAIDRYQASLKLLDNIAFDTVDDLHQEEGHLYYLIGLSHYYMESYTEAQKHARRAVKHDSAYVNGFWLLCQADYYADDYQAILQSCQHYFNIYGSYSTLFTIAYARKKLGQYPKAAAIYERVTKEGNSKQRHRAYGKLGHLYNDKPDFVKAVEYLNQGLSMDESKNTNSDWIWSNRCWAYINLGEYEKAIFDCEMALSLNPSNNHAARNLSNAQKALEDESY